jgi:hypothetical protein
MSLQVEDHVTVDVGNGEEYGIIVADLMNGSFHVRLEESGERHNLVGSALSLACPFDGAPVDSDWRACPDCREII